MARSKRDTNERDLTALFPGFSRAQAKRFRALTCPTYCAKDVNPVCGSDNVIYKNECEMRKRTCNRGEAVLSFLTIHCAAVRTLDAAIAALETLRSGGSSERHLTSPNPVMNGLEKGKRTNRKLKTATQKR